MNLYLFAGYSVVWVLSLGYIISLGVRQRRLEEDLRLLQAASPRSVHQA